MNINMMVLLGLALLVSLSSRPALGRTISRDFVEVSASGLDYILGCTAEPKPGVQYLAVRWYKLRQHPSPHQSGLLTRNLPNGTTRWYSGVERDVRLQGDSYDIFLPNVTCGDSGVYMCYLAAPVGEQNREGKTVLSLSDCPIYLRHFPADSTESPVHLVENPLTDTWLVIFAAAMLMVAFVIFLISYNCLKNTLREKGKIVKKEILLDAPLQPLEKKDLMLIYTLGPKTSTMKHVCV